METWVSVISGLGFPIVVATYLLVVFRKAINDLKDAINENTKVMEALRDKLK